MSWGFVASAAATVVGGAVQAKSAKKATKAQVQAADKEIEFARESRDLARADQRPYREAGVTALDALMSMTGLAGTGAAPVQAAPKPMPGRFSDVRGEAVRAIGGGRRSGYRIHPRAGGGPIYPRAKGGPIYGRAVGGPMMRRDSGPYGWKGPQYLVNEEGPENVFSEGSVTRQSQPSTIDGRTGYVQPNRQEMTGGGGQSAPPVENPGGVEGGYNFMTDPGYEFRTEEGIRALDRSAAARGGLLSGGHGRALTRYGQDYASLEYSNVYNRIANIAGLGQVSAGHSGNAAMRAGEQMGGAASNAGFARASGYTAQGNAWANVGNELAKLPWGGKEKLTEIDMSTLPSRR